MKLWKIWQEINDDYDAYRGAVVAAETEDEARQIHPGYGEDYLVDLSVIDPGMARVAAYRFENCQGWQENGTDDWCKLADVQCKYLGEAEDGTKTSIILTDFRAS